MKFHGYEFESEEERVSVPFVSALIAALQRIAGRVEHTKDCDVVRYPAFPEHCSCDRPQRILAAQAAAIERGAIALYAHDYPHDADSLHRTAALAAFLRALDAEPQPRVLAEAERDALAQRVTALEGALRRAESEGCSCDLLVRCGIHDWIAQVLAARGGRAEKEEPDVPSV